MFEVNKGLFHGYFDIPNVGVISVKEQVFDFIWEVDQIMLDSLDMLVKDLFIARLEVEPDLLFFLE